MIFIRFERENGQVPDEDEEQPTYGPLDWIECDGDVEVYDE